MRIQFERSGGFAGMRVSAEIDSSELAPEEAEILSQEVTQSGFFDLPETVAPSGRGADRFHYHITVETGDQAHSVQIPESAITERLQPLVQHLTHLARRR